MEMETTTNKKITPKQRFQEILAEIFELIEGSVNEGIYLQVGDHLKEAFNLFGNGQEVIRIVELVREARQNRFYKLFYKKPNKVRQHLTEAQKANHPSYSLCNCGRYYNNTDPDYLKEHLETAVHFQGLRNKKLAAKKKNTNIDDEITREIKLTAFCINHLEKINT